MNRKVLYGAIAASGVIALILICVPVRSKVKPDVSLINYLQQKNANLTAQNKILSAQGDALAVERNKVLRERDSLKVVSDVATQNIWRTRATIPSALPPIVTDTIARIAYEGAVRQLDSAIAELIRKDRIIRDDSLALAKEGQMELVYHAQLRNADSMLVHEQETSEQWKLQFTALNNQRHPRCGRKCGIVIGSLAVVGAAMAIDRVHAALNPKRPQGIVAVRIGAF